MSSKKNTFYTDFDTMTLENRPSKDYRTPFQVDRDRIIYSSAFRRLQSKTQVFLSGEYDFYRTRLTHSLEVAQIARSIVNFLRATSPFMKDNFYIDSDLVEVIALTHDIGHPPFGHTGEKMLQDIMEEQYGGFEGNAQTLRIITEIIYADSIKRKGMIPTRAFMDGILKYKKLFRELKGEANQSRKYILDDQARFLAFVYDTSSNQLPPLEARSQSIECQIMDWADNTAYSINDLLDGHRAGFVTPDKLNTWLEKKRHELSSQQIGFVEVLLQKMMQRDFERFMATQVGQFVSAVSLLPVSKPLSEKTNRHAFDLAINPEMNDRYKLYKKIAVDLIFSHPSIQQLEFKGKQIIKKIFEALVEEYVYTASPHVILPISVHQHLVQTADAAGKVRIICDHIAGMTDAYVVRIYKRLFDPDFGSIVDLI